MNIDSSILNTFITLVVSVGLIWLILYFVKKYTLKYKKASDTFNLNVVGKLSLQPKAHLFVVEAGSRKLLIGVSEKNINLISDLSSPSENKAGINKAGINKAGINKVEINKSEIIKANIKDTTNDAVNHYLEVARKAAGVIQEKKQADPAQDDLSFISFIKSTLKKNSN